MSKVDHVVPGTSSVGTEGTKRASTYLFQRSRVRLIGLLALPMTWLVGVYIVSLFLLLVTAFWVINPFTSRVSPGFTLDNFISIIAVPAYLSTSLRTMGMALAVTAIAVVFAVPLGIYMAKLASPLMRNILAVAITLPLWAGYLVKILAMRLVFTENGFINWALGPLGVQSPGFNVWVAIITLTYLWFPYMALPVFTAIRQIPNSLFDASADMGAKSFATITRVVIPLIIPRSLLVPYSPSLSAWVTIWPPASPVALRR